MTLRYLHRMLMPGSYPSQARVLASEVLDTWLRYSPNSQPEERDFEDWAENAIMLHEADRIGDGPVHLLDSEPSIRMSGDATARVPSRPGAQPAFMYGIWRGSDTVHFPEEFDMIGNNAEAVKRVMQYPLSTTFKRASGREFHVCDADPGQLEELLHSMKAAGHTEIFIKTAFKEQAMRLALPSESERLLFTTINDTGLEYVLMQHEGRKDLFYVQEAFDPTHEYRMIIAGDTVATGAGCIEAFTPLDNFGARFDDRTEEFRNSGTVSNSHAIVDRYIDFAISFAKDWAEECGADMIYSLDLALDQETQEVRAIELNPMANLGLYACNSTVLADTIAAKFQPAAD